MSSERNFDAESAAWDESPARRRVAEAVAAAIIRRGGLTPDDSLLDIGCGTGLVTLPLATRVRSVLAVDSAPGMIAQLKAKLVRDGVSNVMPACADGETVPSELFDAIVCTQTLSHVADPMRLLIAMAHRLKEDGVILVSEMETLSEGACTGGRSWEALAFLLGEAGYNQIETWPVLEVPAGRATHRYYLTAGRRITSRTPA